MEKKTIEWIAWLTMMPGVVFIMIATFVSLAWGANWWSNLITGPLFIFSGAWAILCGQNRIKELRKYGYLK